MGGLVQGILLPAAVFSSGRHHAFEAGRTIVAAALHILICLPVLAACCLTPPFRLLCAADQAVHSVPGQLRSSNGVACVSDTHAANVCLQPLDDWLGLCALHPVQGGLVGRVKSQLS